jgi:membrane-associated protein
MEDLVRHSLDAMGVWSVFWLSAVGPYAFPAAGEIAIVLAAGTRSSPLWQIVALAAAGGVASDHAAYWVGRIGGSRLVARFLTPQRRVAYEERVARHAPPWLVLGRLVTGVRTYLAVAAGAGRYSYGLFSAYNLAGCVMWALAFTIVGYLLGAAVDVKSFVNQIEHYSLVVAALVILAYIAIFVWRWSRRRAASTESV